MTDYKTLRVPEDAYEAAREAKRETETWGEFLQRCSETRPEIREFVEATDADAGGATDEVIERLDRNYEAIKEATNAAQNAERAVNQVTQ